MKQKPQICNKILSRLCLTELQNCQPDSTIMKKRLTEQIKDVLYLWAWQQRRVKSCIKRKKCIPSQSVPLKPGVHIHS